MLKAHVEQRIELSYVEIFSIYMAAACHDIDHP